jgi:hypothetical protein
VALSSAARHLFGVQRQEIIVGLNVALKGPLYPATSPSNAVSGMGESDCIQAIACHSAAVAIQRSNVVSDMKSDCVRRVWSFPAVPWRLLVFHSIKVSSPVAFPSVMAEIFIFMF